MSSTASAALRLARLRPERSGWGGAQECPLCLRSASQIREDAIHGKYSRARASAYPPRADGAPSLAAVCTDCFEMWYDGGVVVVDNIRSAVLALALEMRARKAEAAR